MPWSMGHVDFYPNGGQHQLRCRDQKPSQWNLLMHHYQAVADMVKACSHNRVLDLYVESIKHRDNDKYFLSKNCESYEEYQKGTCNGNELPMGEALKPSMVKTNGLKYYLKTGSSSPFNLN